MAKARPVPRKASKARVGSGLDALFQGKRLDKAIEDAPAETVSELSKHFALIPINKIKANPDQPRREFEEEALAELANSISIHGIIQPITVRYMGDDSYQIISGERRFRASKKTDLKEVPAFIRTANDQELLEMGLIENIQREDLNPMEIAFSYLRLKQMTNMTQKELSVRVKAPRSSVANYLGILETSYPVQQAIKEGHLSFGAAKTFAGIKDKGLQEMFLKEVLAHPEWTTRDVEKASKAYKQSNTTKQPSQPKNDDLNMVKEAFQEFFGTKDVKIKLDGKKDKSGTISLRFVSQEQLEQFYKSLEP
jgi:ParB family chromosome partitioning protein